MDSYSLAVVMTPNIMSAEMALEKTLTTNTGFLSSLSLSHTHTHTHTHTHIRTHAHAHTHTHPLCLCEGIVQLIIENASLIGLALPDVINHATN